MVGRADGADSALEEAIRQRAAAFDAPALKALLGAAFPGRQVRFQSRPSHAPRPTPVDSVDPGSEVRVTLNLGLRSSTSPLPSYFHELLADAHAGPALEHLLALLDDRLLRDRFDALSVERAPRLLPRADDMRRDVLDLARAASPVTMHWIFAQIFPELGITVRRAPVARRLPAGDPRLGQAVIGQAALGGEAEVVTQGLCVILTTAETTTWSGDPWAIEARRRLDERAFPVLRGRGAHLRILLVDGEAEGRLELPGPSRIGYDPLVRARPPKVTILFEGPV